MGVVRQHKRGFMADAYVGGRRQRQVFRTRRQAERAILRWEEEGVPDPPARRPSGPTLGEVFDGWLAYKEARTTKPRSMRNAKDSVHRLSRHLRRATPASGLTGHDVDRLIARCRAKGWRPASVNHDLRVLKAALRWAADPDRGAMLERLPIKVKLLHEPRVNGATVRRMLIDDEQLKRLLDESRPKLPAVFALCAFAGLRKDEVVHLRVGDLDLARGVVSVREKPEVDWSPKTHQERDVEIGPRLRAEMERYLGTLKERERDPSAWLFTSQRHRSERLREVAPQVKRAFTRAGIKVPRGGCHTLRKKWATEAGAAGDYEALREMGGWSSWQAMAHYVAAGAARRRKIAELF